MRGSEGKFLLTQQWERKAIELKTIRSGGRWSKWGRPWWSYGGGARRPPMDLDLEVSSHPPPPASAASSPSVATRRLAGTDLSFFKFSKYKRNGHFNFEKYGYGWEENAFNKLFRKLLWPKTLWLWIYTNVPEFWFILQLFFQLWHAVSFLCWVKCIVDNSLKRPSNCP